MSIRFALKKAISLIIILGIPFVCSASTDSLDIKIGQMIMIGINDRTSVSDDDQILEEIAEGKLGGVLLFEKNIAKQNSKQNIKNLIEKLKEKAPIPLLVSIDEEGGKVHRLKEKYGFVGMPSAAYLGKLNNVDSTYFYNNILAEELADLGINFNYAPSLDAAVNPDNTVIVKAERSFSKDPEIISKHAIACIKAHHANGIKTILKHFPGHGSSAGDSHHGIVDVSETWDFKELFPYYYVLNSGNADAIMTAHIINKDWDSNLLPATLSKQVITGMLRGLLGFKGVIFSDDMQMKAISKNYGVDKALELSINAGVDIVMFANSISGDDKPITATQVHQQIKDLVLAGKITKERINISYQRIMRLKNKKV